MKLLCFGDSNTYGYDSRSFFGGRYGAEDRWVDILAQKTGFELVNEGENGREIPWREGDVTRFGQLLARHAPDLLLVMLGSNDLLQGRSVEQVTDRMEALLSGISLEKERVVLIAPPAMQPGYWVEDEELVSNSRQLAEEYEYLAHKLGVRFVNTRSWSVELVYDGVHFSPDGHRIFAENLYKELFH